MEGWHPLFDGDVDGRSVRLERYEPGNELRVRTTQLETETTEGYSDGSSTVLPLVVSKGSPIDIEASSAEELELELMKCSFSPSSAREIARHARKPGG